MTEPDSNWGCAAVGRSGNVTVDVDEAVSGPERWEIALEVSSWYLRFAIPSSSIVARFREFLVVDHSSNDQLTLGAMGGASVAIRNDVEFSDRFHVSVSASDGEMQFTIDGEHRSDLVTALEQAVRDLED